MDVSEQTTASARSLQQQQQRCPASHCSDSGCDSGRWRAAQSVLPDLTNSSLHHHHQQQQHQQQRSELQPAELSVQCCQKQKHQQQRHHQPQQQRQLPHRSHSPVIAANTATVSDANDRCDDDGDRMSLSTAAEPRAKCVSIVSTMATVNNSGTTSVSLSFSAPSQSVPSTPRSKLKQQQRQQQQQPQQQQLAAAVSHDAAGRRKKRSKQRAGVATLAGGMTAAKHKHTSSSNNSSCGANTAATAAGDGGVCTGGSGPLQPLLQLALSEDTLYRLLCQYTVPVEQLPVLGFPQAACASYSGGGGGGRWADKAYVYHVGQLLAARTRQCQQPPRPRLDIGAKEFVPRAQCVQLRAAADTATATAAAGATGKGGQSSSCVSLSDNGSDSGVADDEASLTYSDEVSSSSERSSSVADQTDVSSEPDEEATGSSPPDCSTRLTPGPAPSSSSSYSSSSRSSPPLLDSLECAALASDTSSSSSSASSWDGDSDRCHGAGVLWPHCARCGRQFGVTMHGHYLPDPRAQCVYHWGKLQPVSTPPASSATSTSPATPPRHCLPLRHACCNARPGSRGCSVARQHVWSGLLTGLNGPLPGFVQTRPPRSAHSRRAAVLALDCEMCFGALGLQVARVSVVDARGRRVYDTLVQPERPVLDYNTRFSGITPRRLATAQRSLRRVQSDLLGFVGADTLLVGHGLENDLRALRLVHGRVVDTSLLFSGGGGGGGGGRPWRRRKLSQLAAQHLGCHIHTRADGHDSLQDARICMQLLLWRLQQDLTATGAPAAAAAAAAVDTS